MDILDYIKVNVPHLLLNDPRTLYECSSETHSSKFSYLHKLVMETRKHKILEEYLKMYLQTEKGKGELDLKNNLGWTALMLACRNSNTNSSYETVKILIENKANLDLQSNGGWTALMYACRHSNTDSTMETVKILIENNAKLDLQNVDGWTALMMACCYSNTESTIETVKILIENKANLDLQKNNGWTALMHACRYSNSVSTMETVKILIENKANLDLQNVNGYTALIYLLNNNDIQDFVEYYKILDKNIIEKYITKNKIPINNYDLLVDSKIIQPILPEKYKESKHHIKITIPLRILGLYKIEISECMICSEDKKILVCNYDHHTCFDCLHKLNYKCEFCKCFL